MDREESRDKGRGKDREKGRDRSFRQPGLGRPHSTPWLPVPNASLPAGLLVAARAPGTGWGRPDARGTRLFGQSCPRPAGQGASQEPVRSGGLPEGVEYIPTRKKGKNPMKPVGVAWAIGLPSGIILFLLTKRQVDKNRLEQQKARRAMMEANQGEYDSERYGRMARGNSPGHDVKST
uniref:Uncharacterized protein n=1 Tax=Junco hyemalis TaxID=40217 RepID=A0A8C5JAH1_JUNHY